MKNNLGVALTKTQCPICLKTFDDSIVINTRFTEGESKKVKELHGKVINVETCSECKDYQKQGIIVRTIDPEKSIIENGKIKEPYYTGYFGVIKEEVVKRMIEKGKLLDSILKSRLFVMTDEDAKQIGLIT